MSKVSSRILAIIPILLLQILFYVLIFTVLNPYIKQIQIIAAILSIILVISIVARVDEPDYKESWMIIILLFPVVGGLLYIAFGNKKTGKKLREKLKETWRETGYHKPECDALKEFTEKNKRLGAYLNFGSKYTDMNMYYNKSTRYYPVGEKAFPDMIEDLKAAKKFIFMEYFIMERGVFNDSITKVLKEKAREGVDVRVMYDDLGSIGTYNSGNVKWLTEHGIKVVTFNPIKYVTFKLNNRDHRKMTIIDGEVAYSGGINIADEYINAKEKYGHWKDTSFRIEGDAVINYTYMFFEFWNSFSEEKIPRYYLKDTCVNDGKDGYIFSYYESPVRKQHVSNNLYIEALESATDYIWFFTPYLMLGDTLQKAFRRAATSGVDVRVIVPGIPDKKIAYRMTQSNYRPLLEAGVKIYEYTPGFVHAKSMVCDDKMATIGTVNLDFRSLFLHFENNSLFCESEVIKDVKQDFEDMFPKCKQRTLDDGGPGVKSNYVDAVLRLFSPFC